MVREVYVELPDEDPMKAQGMVGLVIRTMHGCQDASDLWQIDYTVLLISGSYRARDSSPALFYSQEEDARMLIHGDDFLLLADALAIERMHRPVAVEVHCQACVVYQNRGQSSGSSGSQ